MFGLFGKKKKYPLLKPEMIEPIDQPISTTDAKMIFKKYMKDIGYLEKDELSEHASYLGDEIKEMEQCHKEDIKDSKEEIKEAKAKVKELQKKLTSCKSEEEKEEIEEEIDDAKSEIEMAQEQIEESTKELEEFKKDKRQFLVEYINNQIGGSD